MSDKLKCPCCGSEKVYSHDNQFLWHPDSGWGDDDINDDTPQYDGEIYVSFNCHNCDSKFDVIFDLKPQTYWSVHAADTALADNYVELCAKGKDKQLSGGQ